MLGSHSKQQDDPPFPVWTRPGQVWGAPKSAFRALHILELLASEGRPIRAKEICAVLELSPSSANQLLKTMVDWAYLIFDPLSKKYSLSPRLANLGARLSDNYFGLGAIDTLMQDVLQKVGGPVTLSMPKGTHMQLVDMLWPSQPPAWLTAAPIWCEVGLSVPLFGSGPGAAWLSCQNEETLKSAIRLCRRDLGPAARDVPFIMEKIRQVKEQGYAIGGLINYRAPTNRNLTLSFPLPPTRDGVVLILTSTGEKEELKHRHTEIGRATIELIRTHLEVDRCLTLTSPASRPESHNSPL